MLMLDMVVHGTTIYKDHILHDHPEHASVVDSIEPHELPHD